MTNHRYAIKAHSILTNDKRQGAVHSVFKVDTLLAFYLIRLSDSVVGGCLRAPTSGTMVIYCYVIRCKRFNKISAPLALGDQIVLIVFAKGD